MLLLLLLSNALDLRNHTMWLRVWVSVGYRAILVLQLILVYVFYIIL